MNSRRELPAGPSQSRPPSPFPRRPSVSTHQPPPSTPQFGRDPHLPYNPPLARSTDQPRVAEREFPREFPRDAPKGPKALYSQPPSASGPAGGGGSAAHSPHKSSFSAPAGSPHHGGHGHGHHYPQAGANAASRGSQPPPGPRGSVGRGAPLLPSANLIRSPVSTPGGAGISPSGGQMFASSYPIAGDMNPYRASGRRRSGEWESGRGSGRSREREYDYGPRGGSGFGGSFRDRDLERSREFREPRGGYRGRSRDREVFPHRTRSTSRERERERIPSYPSGRGDRDRLERGMNFSGDRRSVFERDEREREPERERERLRLRVERERRDREREAERERDRERLQREREREREVEGGRGRSMGDRERFGGGDRRISMSIERERDRAAERPRVDAREGGYEPSRGDRERERRERDAAEYNRSREAERARFSSAAQPHQVPTSTSPPPVPSYHGNYQPANVSSSASTFGSATQPAGRPPSQQPLVGPSQRSTPAARRTMGGGAAGALPQITYHDRDKVPHRDVSQKMDYRLDTRSSDRAPLTLKKEPTDDISPLTQDSKSASANTPSSALPPPSTGATPISATSSRPYSPPPAQVPSGPRSGTGVNPPTGPRGGPPPTGPRHGADRKDTERKRVSKDRGGSAEYWNTQTPTQSHQTWLEIGSVHPDRMRGIEKVDDRDNKHHISQASNSSEFPTSQESAESSGTAESAGMEHGSTSAIPSTRTSGATTNATPLAPSRSGSSGQGFRGSQNSPNAPTSGLSGAGPLTPTAPAGPSGSPTKAQPPTAPRALQTRSRFRNRGGGGGGGGGVYRSRNNFGTLEGGSDVGHRSAGRAIMGGVDGGMGRGSMDRGRRGSRSGPEPDRLATKEGLSDVDMLDTRSKDEKKEDIVTTLEQPLQVQENIESHAGKTIQSSPPLPAPIPTVFQPPPVVKIEEEDEDDVSLTQADVISKIADIDGDIQSLEQRLEKLDRARMHHKGELERIEEEELRARNVTPLVEEVSVVAQFPEPEKMDLDLPEATNEVEQLQSQAQKGQQERQERADHGEQPAEQLNSEPKPVEEDILDLPDRPRTLTTSRSPTSSPIRSRTPSDDGSIETESDESIKHLMISAHPGLPFYRPGPPLKPTDYDFFHSNIEHHEGIRELVVAQISAQRQATFERETNLKRKYREYFEPWHERCLELEKESSRKKKSNSEPADTNGASPAVTASTAAETPTAVGRRAVRASDVVRSEAELEQVIKNLAEQDEQKADSGSKPPGVKEAYVPAMILDPGDRLIFRDTNRLLQSDDEIKSAFLYDVPPDDWTEPEQKLFCDRYMQFPKQWGKIAQGIQGRDFKACILHYYMTKKAQGYKELQRGGGKRGRGKRRKAANPQKSRQSALIADLGRRGGEEEDADSEDVMPTAMTDSGRPKRAAAPVFGGESNNNQDSEASGKRSGKGDDDESRTGGTKRTRGNNNVGRERGQKRARAPATPAVQPTPPPNVPVAQPVLVPVPDKVDGKEKEEKKEDLGDRETYAVQVVTGLPGIAEQLPSPPLTAPQPVQPILTPSAATEDKKPITIPTPPIAPSTVLPLAPVGIPIPPFPQPPASSVEPPPIHAIIKKEKTDRGGGGLEKPVAQTSSYWSVPEQNDFPHLLAAYGTNWAAIAGRLASKTTVMVRSLFLF
ncbi:hypothetical protein HOY82DRAFT_383453 [Tuber indicum]|nr:hypothetical protein HOY82DRAFT_383453 [Tuber indicum]